MFVVFLTTTNKIVVAQQPFYLYQRSLMLPDTHETDLLYPKSTLAHNKKPQPFLAEAFKFLSLKESLVFVVDFFASFLINHFHGKPHFTAIVEA